MDELKTKFRRHIANTVSGRIGHKLRWNGAGWALHNVPKLGCNLLTTTCTLYITHTFLSLPPVILQQYINETKHSSLWPQLIASRLTSSRPYSSPACNSPILLTQLSREGPEQSNATNPSKTQSLVHLSVPNSANQLAQPDGPVPAQHRRLTRTMHAQPSFSLRWVPFATHFDPMLVGGSPFSLSSVVAWGPFGHFSLKFPLGGISARPGLTHRPFFTTTIFTLSLCRCVNS